MNDSKIFHELGEYVAKGFEDAMKDVSERPVVILEGKNYVDADVYDKLVKERDELKNTCGKMTDIHDMYAKVQEARIEQLEKERDELKNYCEDLAKRYNKLYDEADELKKANDELRASLEIKDKQIGDLSRRCKTLESTNDFIHRDLETSLNNSIKYETALRTIEVIFGGRIL